MTKRVITTCRSTKPSSREARVRREKFVHGSFYCFLLIPRSSNHSFNLKSKPIAFSAFEVPAYKYTFVMEKILEGLLSPWDPNHVVRRQRYRPFQYHVHPQVLKNTRLWRRYIATSFFSFAISGSAHAAVACQREYGVHITPIFCSDLNSWTILKEPLFRARNGAKLRRKLIIFKDTGTQFIQLMKISAQQFPWAAACTVTFLPKMPRQLQASSNNLQQKNLQKLFLLLPPSNHYQLAKIIIILIKLSNLKVVKRYPSRKSIISTRNVFSSIKSHFSGKQ